MIELFSVFVILLGNHLILILIVLEKTNYSRTTMMMIKVLMTFSETQNK